MRVFRRELADRNTDPKGRRWVYAPYDQLTASVGPLASRDPRELGVVLVEAPAKAARRPYHQQKLALLLANQRHFALEQAARGVAVRYVVARAGIGDALAELRAELGVLHMMEAAERELRVELAPLVARGDLEVHPHAGWLTTREDFLVGAGPRAPWRMDAFYRHVRARTGILMARGKPLGGKLSFDAENRKPWRGEPAAPEPPRFAADAITREVVELVGERYAHHPGALDVEHLPARAEDAETLWRWARSACLPQFGPFEDAMSTRSSGLFHTRISPLLNLHRLLPARVVDDVAHDEALALASREGFVRQILGWREFVRHVHAQTDGFRAHPVADAPGDGGFGRWRGSVWPRSPSPGDGGACPSVLGAREPLPPAFWGARSGLACLDRVVEDVWREGWSHHITRLMVLSNLATLLALDPRELTDWFWVAYVDAYDWVVEPNVLAMGTYAVGEVMTTKPYVSGAAYIHRMSDYCGTCAFDPAKSCPITRLYWAFLARHAERFAKNPRFAGPIASVRRRASAEQSEDARVFDAVRAALARGERLDPSSLSDGDHHASPRPPMPITPPTPITPAGDPAVDAFARRAKTWRGEIEALRVILRRCGLDEALKWGKPCFGVDGSNVAIIQPFKAHCALMFFKGALLEDTHGLLRSQGDNTRSALRLEFRSEAEIDEAIVRSYVAQAIAAEKAGLTVDLEAKDTVAVPDELTRALKKDRALARAFEALTPGRRRAYLIHFNGAKKSETRAARIEKCRAGILAGQGPNER